MVSSEDLVSVYQFMKATGEGNLRKMMIDQKLTQTHFNVLMKIVRACTETQFVEHGQKGDFPKVKLNAQEMGLKETFWDVCFGSFRASGLMGAEVSEVKAA